MAEPTDASFSEYHKVFAMTVRELAMIKILIFNVTLLLLLGGTSCSPTRRETTKTRLRRDLLGPSGPIIWSTESVDGHGKQGAIPHSLSLKSPSSSDILHALGTTIHSLPSIDPATSGLRHNAQTIQPSVPSSFNLRQQSQPTSNRPSHNGYEPSSYAPQGNNQFLNVPAGNDKSQYFANPSSYRIIPEATKKSPLSRSSQFPVSTIGGSFSSSFPKFSSPGLLQSGSSDFTNPSKYRFANGYQHGGQRSRPTGHKTTPYSPANNNNNNKNKNIEISRPDVSGNVKSARNEPVLENTGADYRPYSSSLSAHDYSDTKTGSSPASGTFSPHSGNVKARILPIKSAGSTAEIPRYQAASVDETVVNRYEKPFEGYQQLANQPQFHFTRGTTAATPSSESDEEQQQRRPIVYHDDPFQQIRTDVELINKKRTTTPDPFGSDENDFGRVFSTASHNFGQGSVRDENFELPSSNLFDSYDQTFGKYSKLASLELKNSEKGPSSTKHDETTKPVHQSIEEEDNDDDDGDDDDADHADLAEKDDEDKSSSGEYRSSYTDGKDSSGSYEEEDEGEGEEESQRNEQQGSYEEKDEGDDDDDDDEKKASFRSLGDDFEHEFEESYRKDLPKSDYVHVKEVPEIEEPRRSETKKHSENRPRTKATRISSSSSGLTQQQTSNRGAFARKPEVPRKHEEGVKNYFAKSRNNYRDSEGDGTGSSYKNAKFTQDSYGQKSAIGDRGTARFTAKKKDEEKPRKKSVSLTQDRTDKSTNLYYSSTPLAATTSVPSAEQLQSFTFGPFAESDWKPSEKAADRDVYGETRQEIRSIFGPKTSPKLLSEAHRDDRHRPHARTFLPNGQNFRDLTGI